MAVAVRAHALSTEANSTSCVIPKPSGLTAGDLMVVQVDARTDVTVTNLSGWTTIQALTISGVLTQHLAWKIADSADVLVSTFAFVLSGTAVNLGAITAFTGHHTTTPIGANNGTATDSNSATISSAAITPTAAESMICFFAVFGGSNGAGQVGSYQIPTSNPTWTEQYEQYTELGNDMTLSMAHGTRTAVTSTGTGTATADISRNNIGQMIAISPAAAGTSIAVPKGSIEVAKKTPVVVATANVFIAVPRGQIQANPKTPVAKLNTNIAVPLGQITCTKQTPVVAVTAHVFIAVPRGQITATPQTPVVATTANLAIAVPKGSINVQGYAPEIIAANDITIQIPLAQITVAKSTPTIFVLAPQLVAVPKGEIQVTGYAPVAKLNTFIAAPKGSISVTGFAPTMVVSGPQVVSVPRAQITVTAFAPIVNPADGGGLTMMGIGS